MRFFREMLYVTAVGMLAASFWAAAAAKAAEAQAYGHVVPPQDPTLYPAIVAAYGGAADHHTSTQE